MNLENRIGFHFHHPDALLPANYNLATKPSTNDSTFSNGNQKHCTGDRIAEHPENYRRSSPKRRRGTKASLTNMQCYFFRVVSSVSSTGTLLHKGRGRELLTVDRRTRRPVTSLSTDALNAVTRRYGSCRTWKVGAERSRQQEKKSWWLFLLFFWEPFSPLFLFIIMFFWDLSGLKKCGETKKEVWYTFSTYYRSSFLSLNYKIGRITLSTLIPFVFSH